MDRPTLLLVHGAWHGPWAWEALRAVLDARGWRTTAVELPSVHADDKAERGMRHDADAVAAAIDAIDGEVLVVAHSYGGIPTTQAATSPKVVGIVYIAAFVLDEGETLFQAVGGVQPDWWDVRGPVLAAGHDEHDPRDLFFGDVEPAVADAAVARLTTQSLRTFTDPLTAVAWRDRPTTYVVTEEDAVVPVAGQEAMAGRAGSIVRRMTSSHSPFLSQPEAVADVIEEAVERAGAARRAPAGPEHRVLAPDVTAGGKGPASYFPSIERTYGRPVQEWLDLVVERLDGRRHMEVVAWLKSEQGLGHGHANALVAYVRAHLPQ